MPIPLERPELPRLDEPLVWPGVVVSIFGAGDLAFAERLRERRPEAALMRVSLRHGEGWQQTDRGLVAHPDALLDALGSSRPAAPLVIGVGAPFAAAVKATLGIWITDGMHAIALPPALRAAARRAQLVIEEARPALAEYLADAL